MSIETPAQVPERDGLARRLALVLATAGGGGLRARRAGDGRLRPGVELRPSGAKYTPRERMTLGGS